MSNQYDNEPFFNAYSKMDRSRYGLEAAGEWQQFKRLLPPLSHKKVLDLGCGYGWHCKYVETQGAKEILGIDSSQKMLDFANNNNFGKVINYQLCGIKEYDYPIEKWDCVISNLALHYIDDLDFVFQKVHNTLKSNGTFIFNMEHPVFTSAIHQDWIYDKNGNPLYWPIDNYFETGKKQTRFLGQNILKEHHTLTQILMGLLQNGFEIQAVIEVEPPKEMRTLPGFEHELRRPMMLMVKALVRK
ncbi:hypothetical protein HMPREF9318_00013 [Streptococcus urinalis FB127-CNA-2]|uniref:Ribosomal protein L11 methyltransferase-like protein n=1 Tax=Streptococcus urinalis 2285-97 TaxID=764291 RepID=G5KE38_9STRE|nr:class I SAM-dependent methyltransferase [Streptococcus urinalis]EHJ57364.1 ribosomal protein L11 methyltransferase-like protein [Streptococcus urinalis 2285-97]EKS21815.1 hypothetical protein HMPREF9318_00013 [Streptococcus urinalis FB127-CNA-2]VEF31628.1 methyltransferase [Streptococcus urinalis]